MPRRPPPHSSPLGTHGVCRRTHGGARRVEGLAEVVGSLAVAAPRVGRAEGPAGGDGHRHEPFVPQALIRQQHAAVEAQLVFDESIAVHGPHQVRHAAALHAVQLDPGWGADPDPWRDFFAFAVQVAALGEVDPYGQSVGAVALTVLQPQALVRRALSLLGGLDSEQVQRELRARHGRPARLAGMLQVAGDPDPLGPGGELHVEPRCGGVDPLALVELDPRIPEGAFEGRLEVVAHLARGASTLPHRGLVAQQADPLLADLRSEPRDLPVQRRGLTVHLVQSVLPDRHRRASRARPAVVVALLPRADAALNPVAARR